METVVVLIGSLKETGFEVVQTDLLTKNRFPIGENMFPLLETLMLLVKKTVTFQLTRTYFI